MSEDKRYTVLGFGERYVVPADKKRPGPQSQPVGRPLAEVRAVLTPRVLNVLREVSQMKKERCLAEVVVELRLDDKFLAKSYTPGELLSETGLTVRGTGSWVQYDPLVTQTGSDVRDDQPRKSRALFVSGTAAALKKLQVAVTHGLTAETDADIIKLQDIRLPEPAERLGTTRVEDDRPSAVEVVLYDWNGLLLKHAIERVVSLLERFGVPRTKTRVRTYSDGPTFIAAVAAPEAIAELGEYNFLRSARPLPRINLARTVTRHAFSAVRVPLGVPRPIPRVAIFDGGYVPGNPLLDPYVTGVDLTPKPPDAQCVEHGTMVASAAVYGPLATSGAIPAPSCRAIVYRVLPDPTDDALELYGAIDAIEDQVPRLPQDVRVANISFGPAGPIGDIPSRFTFAIDRLAREHELLFVTAVGNDGDATGLERIQAPSDSVNNLAVGAVRLSSNGALEHAWYSCQGPGRYGGHTKPDLVAFGGCEQRPFYALVPTQGQLGDPAGTSFAAPFVASIAGRLSALIEMPNPLSPESLRALLIHTAKPLDPYPPSHVGYGVAAKTIEEVLECSARRVSVLYQGAISPRDSWKLPFLLPPGFAPGGKVKFSWTVVYAPDVQQGSPDEYTLAGIELAFRPHSDLFSFQPPKGLPEKSKILNIMVEAVAVNRLERDGWRRGALPVSDSQQMKTERALRAQDKKWETVVPGYRTKHAKSISEPMLTIGVLGRGPWDTKNPALKARYAAVLTVDAPKYDGDLYADVLAVYPKLKAMTLRQQPPARDRLRT